MRAALPICLLLTACGAADSPQPLPNGAKADRIVVVKHQGWLTAYDGEHEIVTFFRIDLGTTDAGRKRFKGDGLTPEGDYLVKRQNLDAASGCVLHLSYPNAADRAYAETRGRAAGDGIAVRAKIPMLPRNVRDDWPTDGGIALGYAEMRQLCSIVPDGIPITIRP